MRLITIEEQICPICLDVLNPLTQKIELKCTHVYHKKCIDKWLHKHYTCPLCRERTRVVPSYSIDYKVVLVVLFFLYIKNII